VPWHWSNVVHLVLAFDDDDDGNSNNRVALPVPAMIPLVDLCKHCTRTWYEIYVLSYDLVVCENDSDKDNDDHVVVVHASRDTAAGECLSITYGALSNATLLVQYGFCLPDNVEPDGSSNDVYDFVVTCRTGGVTTTITLPLRTGPKSYTYSLFIRALECFYSNNDDNNEAIVYGHNRNSSQKSPEVDRTVNLNDYLYACYQEDPNVDGDFDCESDDDDNDASGIGPSDDEDEDEPKGGSMISIKCKVKALHKC